MQQNETRFLIDRCAHIKINETRNLPSAQIWVKFSQYHGYYYMVFGSSFFIHSLCIHFFLLLFRSLFLIFDQWWIVLRFVPFVAFFVLFSKTNGHSNVSEECLCKVIKMRTITALWILKFSKLRILNTLWNLNAKYIEQQATDRWIWKIFIKMISKYSSRKQKKCETITKLLWMIRK